jgi:hypothetical protein
LARKRRLHHFVRQLGADLHLDFRSCTRTDRDLLFQCAALMLQAELTQGRLIDGSKAVDPDVVIRLTSEARRILFSLRERARQDAPAALRPWSPFKERGLYAPERESSDERS